MFVERIFISPERGAAQIECEQITAHNKMGIAGDRNFGKSTHPGQNITLIEAEEIELFCATHARLPDLSITRYQEIFKISLHRVSLTFQAHMEQIC